MRENLIFSGISTLPDEDNNKLQIQIENLLKDTMELDLEESKSKS